MSRNIDVIGIGTDLLINRDQFRFAYISGNDETSDFTVVLVFDGGPDGELAVPHPEGKDVRLETARAVLHDFHNLLVTLT